jgi:NADPH:quinone reductase-like Zn-dependent oxidoreductase
MKGWVVRDEGAPWEVFRWEEFPEPTHDAMARLTLDLMGLRERKPAEPACEHYVFLFVRAAALAWPDVTMATGDYPVPVPRPYVSGQEAVGIVEDAAPSLRHFVGKRVMAFTPQPFGSFAPYCVVTMPTLYECPAELSDEEGAAFLIASHTAYHAVHRRGQVRAGETALVLGASGGVPSAALQLCVAAGLRTIAVAGGAEKAAFCRSLGAQVVIDHRSEDVAARVRDVTSGRGVDVIIDFVQGREGGRRPRAADRRRAPRDGGARRRPDPRPPERVLPFEPHAGRLLHGLGLRRASAGHRGGGARASSRAARDGTLPAERLAGGDVRGDPLRAARSRPAPRGRAGGRAHRVIARGEAPGAGTDFAPSPVAAVAPAAAISRRNPATAGPPGGGPPGTGAS